MRFHHTRPFTLSGLRLTVGPYPFCGSRGWSDCLSVLFATFQCTSVFFTDPIDMEYARLIYTAAGSKVAFDVLKEHSWLELDADIYSTANSTVALRSRNLDANKDEVDG